MISFVRQLPGLTRANCALDDEYQTRTGTPTSTGPDGEASEEPTDAQTVHRELMSRILDPHGSESAGRVAEQFFPRHEEGTPVKSESEGEKREECGNKEAERNDGEAQGVDGDQEMAEARADAEDVVMKEASETQAIEQQAAGEAPEAGTDLGEDRAPSATAEERAGVAT